MVVTTMPLLRAGELATIHEIARLDAALVDHRFLDVTEDLNIDTIEYGGDTGLALLMTDKSDRFDDVATSSDDVALLAFTSGTTGRPKSTMHFHRDVLAICDTFSVTSSGRPRRHLHRHPPFGFTFGLGGVLLFPLHAGASTLLIEKASPTELADLINEHEVTVCFTAPTAYKAMLAGDTAMPTHQGGLRRRTPPRRRVAGVPRGDRGGHHRRHRRDRDAAHLHLGRRGRHPAGLDGKGRPRLCRHRARRVRQGSGPGVSGRLAVKGPTGCRYLNDTRQRTYVHDGWNVTGDTFSRDEDGYFWYHARSDDMIISSGYNIAAPEVEEALLKHPEVSECAVVGVPDEARGAIVKAFVVLTPGIATDDVKRRELQDFVKAEIAPYKYPRALEFVDGLPRTATGKLQRFRLRQEA